MYQYQFINNAAGSNDECITFKALAVEPYYMQGPNPTEHANYTGSNTEASKCKVVSRVQVLITKNEVIYRRHCKRIGIS
jgi:hypothetical protein